MPSIAGDPHRKSSAKHIPGDIYRWASQPEVEAGRSRRWWSARSGRSRRPGDRRHCRAKPSAERSHHRAVVLVTRRRANGPAARLRVVDLARQDNLRWRRCLRRLLLRAGRSPLTFINSRKRVNVVRSAALLSSKIPTKSPQPSSAQAKSRPNGRSSRHSPSRNRGWRRRAAGLLAAGSRIVEGQIRSRYAGAMLLHAFGARAGAGGILAAAGARERDGLRFAGP